MFAMAVLGLLMLAAVLVVGARAGEQVLAKALGLTRLRWFDTEQAPAPPWKRWVVRTTSVLVPYGICALLFFVVTVADGTPESTTAVLVLPDGPAQQAGIQNGDRIVKVGGAPIHTFEELRARVQAQSAKVQVEVERSGERLELLVTPKDGRIGVSAVMAKRDVGAARAAASALHAPLRVVAEASKVLVDWHADTQLRGPVGIVSEASTKQRDGWSAALRLFATLGSYAWPFLAAAHVFDELTGWLFRTTAAAVEPRAPARRLARLQFSMYCALGCWLAALIAQGAVGFGVPGAALLFALALPGVWATWPLLWASAAQLWTYRHAFGLMIPLVIAPCVVPLAAIAFAHLLSGELRRLRSHP